MTSMGARNLKSGERVLGVGTTHLAIRDMGFEKTLKPVGVLYLDDANQPQLRRIDWFG